MSAPGSAITTSPIIAKLADTPPIVGSVNTEMNGNPSVASCVNAAVVLAICMRDINPSCMRAPPLAAKQMNGICWSMADCTPRTKRSPTTDPIDPPMKRNSKAAITTGKVLMAPCITTSASLSPLSVLSASRRSV
jgi:hypothetical protein